ncbi:PREDICTED: uncharacterized protein LOC108777614 [Cyphomyrmex costatus]|uniref:uncharacterized protein LOC108777614 n=1 Tax=Cyphomyrmex costatus TaxID=456900 RepID=UPI0008523E7B|nr:PREDICTED: uncharacterized protein LOC108777614 [Cyphomyrmex costatus]
MYEFLYKTAVCASRRERSKTLESEIKGEPSAKRRRIQASNQTFLSSASRTRINCVMCKDKRHPLFMCEKFKQLSVPKRIETLLTSAIVYIRDHKRNRIKCRVLLDTCATANFITESLAKCLNAHVTKYSTPVGTINTMNTESKGIVHITIQSTRDDFSKDLTCLLIPTIAELIPAEVFPRNAVKIPANVNLADPEFHLPRPVDLLIGSGGTLSLFSVGQINLSCEGHDLYLQKTRLGWVVAGGTTARVPTKPVCYLSNLEKQVAKFWTVEELAEHAPKSKEETECEAHFEKTVSRDNDGCYTVRLPFRNSNVFIGESRSLALKRLMSLERRLNANLELRAQYEQAINEYLVRGHASLIENPRDNGYYMPHHAVIKDSSNTTKLRVVFDASAKSSNGLSLNDLLMVGPTIQDKLFSHLIRFRTYRYVITADIEKMYLQVLVHAEDRQFQRFLWRRENGVETFQINKLPFGISSSPFLATRVLQKLADDEGHAFPQAAQVLKSHLYVDDLLTGANTILEARMIRDDIIALLARGKFSIRQWASNDRCVVDDLATSALHANLVFKEDRALKTLGIMWSTSDDKIHYLTNPIKITERITKRNLLSDVAKIYDPLGLLSPIVLYAKRLMQRVWQCDLHWDESISQDIYTDWLEFARQLEIVNRISFDRQLFIESASDVQMHGFCDASTVGYGACWYIRSKRKRNVSVRLISAKSRLAPLKTITVPRLELCGALLLARLYKEIRNALNISPSKTIFWCDSTIALHWIKTSPHLLKTYVANRIAEIQEIVGTHEWRHVRSEDNPADAVSRGQLPHAFIQNRMWPGGPSWLTLEEDQWPNEIARLVEVPDLKKNICLTTTMNDFNIVDKFSSYSKLCRIVAYCLRLRSANNYFGSLCAKEIHEAEIRILKLLQATRFSDEIKELKIKGSTNITTRAYKPPYTLCVRSFGCSMVETKFGK